MVKKLDVEKVKKVLSTKGWELCSFISTRVPLICKCPKGHKQYKRYFQFKKDKVVCLICENKNSTKKISLEEAKQGFKNNKLILKEKKYINAHTKMKYVCEECGYEGKKPLYSVRLLNSGCPKCAGVLKYTINQAKAIFK